MGVLIWWESRGTDMPSGGTKADRETLLNIETAEYVPPNFQIVVELWSVEDAKRKKFTKLLSY